MTSLRLAQQQHRPIWINHAIMLNELAIHMNANILAPRFAPIFISAAALSMTFLKIMNMIVAITVATVVVKAEMKAKMAIGRVNRREYIDSGVRNILMKAVHAPVRKRPNIQRETTRTRERAETMSEGRATRDHYQPKSLPGPKGWGSILVAPASSSFRMICTGSNQYSVTGLLQPVMPCPS